MSLFCFRRRDNGKELAETAMDSVVIGSCSRVVVIIGNFAGAGEVLVGLSGVYK